MIRYKISLLASSIFLTLVISCNKTDVEKLPFYNSPDFTPEWIKNGSGANGEIHNIAPFSFTNQNNETVTQETFSNKIYVADFFFTSCPGICPKLTKNMSDLQEYFINDEEILLLSHTVTPWMDTVAQLKNYAENNDIIDGKWHLVTGDQEKLYTIARKYYFAEMDEGYNKTADDFLHTENFILVDKQRRIRGVYNGTLSVNVNRLIKDIELLKHEE